MSINRLKLKGRFICTVFFPVGSARTISLIPHSVYRPDLFQRGGNKQSQPTYTLKNVDEQATTPEQKNAGKTKIDVYLCPNFDGEWALESSGDARLNFLGNADVLNCMDLANVIDEEVRPS